MVLTKNILSLMLVVVLVSGLSTVQASEGVLPDCPVMGEPINLAVSTATEDGPVYFCCGGCIKRYNANPEKYAQKVANQRTILAKRDKVQVTCPVTKKVVDPKVSIEHNGEKVYFCCTGCVGKFKSDPSKYAAALANSYTYQTSCPVMDEPIKPNMFTTLASGAKVYYCCNRCEKKLLADPEKYAVKLAAQGYDIGAKKLRKKEDSNEDDGHEGHGHEGHGHEGHNHGG